MACFNLFSFFDVISTFENIKLNLMIKVKSLYAFINLNFNGICIIPVYIYSIIIIMLVHIFVCGFLHFPFSWQHGVARDALQKKFQIQKSFAHAIT